MSVGRSTQNLNLPEKWSRVRLEDVAVRATGHTPDKQKPVYWDGGIKWVSLADSNKLDRPFIFETDKEISAEGIRRSSAKLLPTGTVVLLRDAAVGRSTILGTSMAVSQHFVAWTCGERLNNRFLYYYLQSQKHYFERMAVGSTIVTIGMGLFRKLTIPLPPRSEQDRIASLLADWDRAIDLTELLIAAKQERRAWLMQQLLTGKLRLSERGKIWKEVRIGDFLSESRLPGTDGKTARKITVKLYGLGVFAKTDVREGSENTRYYSRRAGQFIYSKLDFLNGAFGLVPNELDGFQSTLDLPCFDVKKGLNPKFLFYFVSRENFYTQFLGSAMGGRKARRVNPSEFLSIRIKLPEIEEQIAIVDAIGVFDREIDLLRTKLDALQEQKKGMMQQLLTGKVRVKA